jgi:ribose/xylose/arabinose/galactoside ABC-type transport system permease subunit
VRSRPVGKVPKALETEGWRVDEARPSDADASAPRKNGSMVGRALLGRAARVGGLVLAIALVMAYFAIESDGLFLKTNNLLGMLRYMSTVAIIGLGLTTVLIVGEIDLSFPNVFGLSAMMSAVAWIEWGWPLWAAIVAAYAAAWAVGSFNAFFTAVVKIPSFVATLGSSTLILGFTLYVSKSNRYDPRNPPPGKPDVPDGELGFFRGLANQDLPLDLPMQVVWMAGIAIVFWVALHRSLFGFRLRAIGGNQNAARLAKLPVVRYKWVAFLIVATAAATAALLDFSYVASVAPDSGLQLLFPTFAAVIIGGASLQGGHGTVLGTLLGALLLAVIANGLAVIAAGAFAQQILLGVVTIGAVVLDQLTQRWRTVR